MIYEPLHSDYTDRALDEKIFEAIRRHEKKWVALQEERRDIQRDHHHSVLGIRSDHIKTLYRLQQNVTKEIQSWKN